MNKANLTAYEVVTEENLTDIHSTGWLLRHKKTGARVMLIENDDENKVFNIAFRTPPKDSTGVAHILEHSVLCGSREFPLKDPFVELVKGSLNTFLNAMTYPDKTCYPVASCNDKDFQNLMHVYLDAVFYPNIYKREEIFRQEGWNYHLEQKEGPLKYNGVVYNEMKGAFSSPDEFASFISMVMQNSSDMIEQAHEETARATIANLIGGVYAAEVLDTPSGLLAQAKGGRRAINLLKLFNESTGLALKVVDVFKTENFESFVKFAFSTVNTIADLMTDRNSLFCSQLTNYNVIRHTPKDRMKFYLYTDLVNKINSEVYSTVFNPDFLKVVDFEKVNYWQAALSPSSINVKRTMLKKDGTLSVGVQSKIDNVFGVLFDEDAAGYTTINEWAQPSPFNARGGYYNQFWHFTDRYWNDFTENAVIFYIEDPIAS